MKAFLLSCTLLFALALVFPVSGAPVSLVEQAPLQITNVEAGVTLIDFGRVAFGNVALRPPPQTTNKITVHFGESLVRGRIDRKPPGSVRYARVEVVPRESNLLIVAPEPDSRNTKQPEAVLTPPEWGVVLPFRWVEIENWPGELRSEQIMRRAAFASSWDDKAAAFHCSDETLNRIWELCRYSIKATTFAGVYVDGDRERISYEADAYLNQLGQYYTDGDVQMARDTFDRLMTQPTWPTEWASHMIFMAHADWMQTGDTNWLAKRYEALKSKLLLDRTRADGLLVSTKAQIEKGDLVDWPPSERDGYVLTSVNTVVNAFYLRSLVLMSELARALHKNDDAKDYSSRAEATRAVFQEKFFDPASGLYKDGEGTTHNSLHANFFPLAFDLVPAKQRTHIIQWLEQRGMACSVYSAQYLLESLFENDHALQALNLITAPTDRSWKHMAHSGTTITWEAWDQRFKPNQDWNHAWGAAPANLLPRFVLGVQPLAPGWRRVLIRPSPGSLKNLSGRVPTPRGPIEINYQASNTYNLTLSLPSGVSAQVQLPAEGPLQKIKLNGKPASAHRSGERWILDEDVTGTNIIKLERLPK